MGFLKKVYYKLQCKFIENHLGFSLIFFCGDTKVAKYATVNILFIDLFISISVGYKYK
jgi:hypothetical protein